MFVELFPFVQEAQDVTLRLTVDKQDPTKLQVYVCPNHPEGKSHPALSQPIMFCETPQVLDTSFAAALQELTPEYVSTSSSIAEVVASLRKAKDGAKKGDSKPAKGAQQKAPPSTPASGDSKTLELFDDLGTSNASDGSTAAGSPGAGDVDQDDDDTDDEQHQTATGNAGAFQPLTMKGED